ncbi:HupE/UreJ family protein [Granulicella arctica]|uniref:HupE/UreJ family protein n=1 Tax=Granulicella arctica TaxID=940613 RepID=UPI0021E0D5E6|nr:HupE/UreJ family protein [Granulicella arctica]
MRLIPGVSVSSSVIDGIDRDHNGVFSEAEQEDYTQRVLDDLTFTANGQVLFPHLASATYPQVAQMRTGLGEIHIQFTVPMPLNQPHYSLIVENHHQNPHSVYLVNATVSTDPSIHILSQERNEQQSRYELDYDQTSAVAHPTLRSSLLLIANISTFRSLFHLGIEHIAEGTDHLLFLLALLLPAPLLAAGSSWATSSRVSDGLLRILKIVTAFTLGHSITLALAALGFVHVPSRPVEILIAVSILVSAIHAVRPIFPGREAAIAAFFGLIHGLAFASTLNSLGLGWSERLTGILAFNIGIETMQLIVVAVVLPSLLLLSRTPAYSYLRVPSALFAAIAALGWICQRLLNISTPVDRITTVAAKHAPVMAVVLFLFSVACWRYYSSTSRALEKLSFRGRRPKQASTIHKLRY